MAHAGKYEITAYGAGNKWNYGTGAIIRGVFNFEINSSITIAIGQIGKSHFSGNGGTFVVDEDSSKILVIAGGAGGLMDMFESEVDSNFCKEFVNSRIDKFGNRLGLTYFNSIS